MTNSSPTPMETYVPPMDVNPRQAASERVLADLKTLIADTESLLAATADVINDKAAEVRERIRAALDRAKLSCEMLQTQTVVTAAAAIERTDHTIRTHPYHAIGVAFSLGVLVGNRIRIGWGGPARF